MTRARADHSEVRRLAALGRKTQTIATILGCCMEDVARVLNPDPDAPAKNDNAAAVKAELTFQDRRALRDDRFRAMWLAEVPRDEICRALGMSVSTITADRIRLGLAKRAPGVKPRKATK
jgi:hypothetical protein